MKLRIKEDYEDMFEFEISSNIDLSYVNLNVMEDWRFDKNDMILPYKADATVLKDLQNQINNKIEKYLIPTLEECLLENSYHIDLKNPNKKYTTGSNLKSNDSKYLSYACYFNIVPNYFDVDCSNSVASSINGFRLRVANHISKQELNSIENINNVKLFVQNIDNLYATKFIKCTENILNAYTEFLNTLATYPQHIENFTDILPEHIQALKKWQKQGF